MISFSRVAGSDSAVTCGRMCCFQSGMFPSRDQPDGLDELVPGLALSRQHALPCRRQPIKPPPALALAAPAQVRRLPPRPARPFRRNPKNRPPALARFFDPPPLDPAALSETIEQRIERIEVKPQPPARVRLDQFAKLVAVPGSGL